MERWAMETLWYRKREGFKKLLTWYSETVREDEQDRFPLTVPSKETPGGVCETIHICSVAKQPMLAGASGRHLASSEEILVH